MRTVLTSLALATFSLLGSFAAHATPNRSLDPMGLFVSPRNGMFADAYLSLFFGGGGQDLLSPTCTVPNGGSGNSSISFDDVTHTLTGGASTIYYTRGNNDSSCSVSATMTGPGVNVSGSDPDCDGPNAFVTLTSQAYQAGETYCITATHNFPQNSCGTNACITIPGPKVTSLTFDQILTDDLPIDTNPNAGGGLRIFPDKKVPAETVDRRKIRVKAQYSTATAGVRIYFRNFDVDDPSADTAPIDASDSPTITTGNDNNGNVDGTTATRAGLLIVPPTGQPNPYSCQTFSNSNATGVSCLTDGTGAAIVDFQTTMQPGDNFSVVAGPDETYVSGLVLAANGIDLKDTNNTEIPVTTSATNECSAVMNRACRTDMLTVWRRLHMEVDSMGKVGMSNNVHGTIAQVGSTSCLVEQLEPPTPVPDSSPSPCPTPAPSPCEVNAGFFVQTNDPLETARFENGRIKIGAYSFRIRTNDATSVILYGVPQHSQSIRPGSTFVLYDDDDYNNDDGINLDGDELENVVKLPNSFTYVLSEDGTHADGRPKNLFGDAYIRPEYQWAETSGYNQANLQFELNVEEGPQYATLLQVLSRNRDSESKEADDFWITYTLVGYQGPKSADFDGSSANGADYEQGLLGVSPIQFFDRSQIGACDCQKTTTCPPGGMVCQLMNGGEVIPVGANGSLIFQEVLQDYTKYFLSPPPPIVSRTIDEIRITIPHEIGHQFGLLGDQKRMTFKIMDYSNYLCDQINEVRFNPEHLNLMRRRVRSPGK